MAESKSANKKKRCVKKGRRTPPTKPSKEGVQTYAIVSDYIDSNFSLRAVVKKRKMDFYAVRNHIESETGKQCLQFYSNELKKKAGPAFEKLMQKCAKAIDKPLKPVEAAKIIMDAVGLSVGARQAKAMQAQRAEKASEAQEGLGDLRKQWDSDDEARIAEYQDKTKNSTPSVQ